MAKNLIARGHPQRVGTGTGGKIQGVVANLAELDIGRHHLHNLSIVLTKQVAAFEGKNIDGSIGVPLWKSGIITFDYPDNRLCIKTRHK